MANISLTIPDAVLPRLVDAVGVKFDFSNNHQASETKAQFARRMLMDTLKQWVIDGERVAVEASHKAAIASVEADITSNVVIS